MGVTTETVCSKATLLVYAKAERPYRVAKTILPARSHCKQTVAVFHRITESQNHRMVGVGRDLCGSSSPPPLPKQGHLQQAAQDLVQAGLEYLQRRRLHNPSGQPVPVLRHPQREEVLPHVQLELPMLQFVPVAPCPITARGGGPSAWRSGRKQQAARCQPGAGCPLVGDEALLLIHAHAAQMRRAPNRRKEPAFQKPPTDQPDKISWQLSSYTRPQRFSAAHTRFAPHALLLRRNGHTLRTAQRASARSLASARLHTLRGPFALTLFFFPPSGKPVSVLFYSPDHAYWASL